MPTVLERPSAVRPLTGPPKSFQVAGRSRRKGLVVERPAVLVDSHESVRPFVRVAPNCHHGRVSFQRGIEARSVDATELGRLPRSYEVTPAGLFLAWRAAIQMKATAASALGSQPVRPPEHDTQVHW